MEQHSAFEKADAERLQPSENLSTPVQRALDVLQAIAFSDVEIGVSDLSATLAMPKASVHRLLANLEARGLVERDPSTSRYRTGLALISLASRVSDRARTGSILLGETRRRLEELVADVGETAYVAVLDQGEALYIESVEGTNVVRAAAPVGTRLPLHCSAVGKVLLSEMDAETVDRLVGTDPFPRYTGSTTTDPMEFRRMLVEVRQQAYSLNSEEFTEGLMCMAAPIRNRSGAIIAALSLTGPKSRLHGEKLAETLERVVNKAAEMSQSPRSPADVPRPSLSTEPAGTSPA